MDYQFNSREWLNMTADERVRRCTILAEEAQRLAGEAEGSFKELYLQIAADWLTLALEIRKGQ